MISGFLCSLVFCSQLSTNKIEDILGSFSNSVLRCLYFSEYDFKILIISKYKDNCHRIEEIRHMTEILVPIWMLGALKSAFSSSHFSYIESDCEYYFGNINPIDV